MITVSSSMNGLVFGISGTHRLDITNSGQLEKKVTDKETETVKSVMINLAGIRFIDTTGFTVLLRIQGRILGQGKEFRIINVSGEAAELILLLKLDRVLDYTP